MEIMTLVWFAGGFFGQLSVVIIRLRAILMLATQLLSCVQLPAGWANMYIDEGLSSMQVAERMENPLNVGGGARGPLGEGQRGCIIRKEAAEAMFQLLKRDSNKRLVNRRNGDDSNLEETEEEKSNGKTLSFEGIFEEKTWNVAELEAVAAVTFKAATFFKDLIYHTFYPLTIPLMMWWDGGWYALANRGFLFGRVSVAQATLACCFYMFNGASLFYLVQGHHFDFLYDIALVDILWVIRNAVVATKYAFASKADMKKMQTMLVHSSEHYYRTLLGGWADPIPRKVLKQELILAAVRCRVMLSTYSFQLDTSVDSLEALHDMISDLQLEKDDPKHKNTTLNYAEEANRWLETGREECLNPMAWTRAGAVIRPGSLPVQLYAAHIIRQSSSLSRLRRVGHTLLSQNLKKCAFFVAVGLCVVPFVLRTLLGGHKVPGPNWAEWTIAVTSFIILYFSMYSNIAFMMVGILDLRRRHYAATKLDELLRTRVYTGSDHVRPTSYPRSFRTRSLEWLQSINISSRGGSASSPGSSGRSSLSGQGIAIDFHNAESLQAWWICRMLVRDFGMGFFKRIKYYTTYFACYCGVLIIFVAIRLIKGIMKEDIYIIASVLLCLDVFLTLLALMVWPGGDINKARQVQGATLTHSKLKLQMKINKEKDHLSPEEVKNLYVVMKTLSSLSEAIKWDNHKYKISVCGFGAGEQLLSLIFAIVAASLSIGVGQIVSNLAGSQKQ